MSWLKKIVPTILLISFVYGWYFLFYTKVHPRTLVVPQAESGIELFTQPESGSLPLTSMIDSAQKEVLVEVYILSDKNIITSLENAESRGVAVDVMMEQHPFGGGNLNPKTRQELTDHGVAVSWSNSNFALTHEKSIVIDDSILFVLSQNLSESSFTKNREYDVKDTNKADVDEVRNIFMADWKRENFTPPNDTHLIVSPNNSRAGITTLINNAQSEIDIEIEDIADNVITQTLSQKAKNIPVKVIIPTLKQINSNKKDVDRLVASGVAVKTLASPYIHAKLILADNSTAYTGSVNFSSQSMDENRELGIILSEPTVISTLAETFQKDWTNATPYDY